MPHALLHSDHASHSVVVQSIGHALSWHRFCSDSCPHSCPDPSGDFRTPLVRCLEPKPQLFEHPPHELQGDNAQSCMHGPSLQDVRSTSDPQASPPYLGASWICLLRLCSPGPHDAVHLDHSSHAEVMQLVAHGRKLHDLYSVSAPHEAPSFSGSTSVVRSRTVNPVPHVFEQMDQEVHCDC